MTLSTRMRRSSLSAVASLRTLRQSCRVMLDPDLSYTGIVPYQATAPIEGVGHTLMAPMSETAVKRTSRERPLLARKADKEC